MSLLKLLWMNYGWLDPLGRVRRQPHWCNHFRVNKSYVEVRLRFEKSSPRWRIVERERKSRKSTKEAKAKKNSSSHRSTARSTAEGAG